MDKKLAEEKVREYLNSLTPEQLTNIQNDFAQTIDKIKNESVEKLEALKLEKIKLEADKKELGSDYVNWDKKKEISKSIEILNYAILNQENIVKVLENNGLIGNITDEDGYEYKDVPDFRRVDTSEFNFDEKTILSEPIPKYVPFINEEKFRGKGYVFDAIRVTEDSYMVSVGTYQRGDKEMNCFFIATLDQLVLIIDYYTTKAKAKNIEDANRANERSKDHYFSLSEEKRRYYMFQRGIYGSLSVANKKKISKEDFEALDLEGREKYYLPIKHHATKRIASKLGEDTMWASFHYMYEDLIDKTKISRNKDGNPDKNGRYADPIVMKYWRDFAEMINYKLKDIKIQRQDYSDTYKQAVETSFGESNTDTILKEEYGILVKRQNGDKIKPNEIELIKESWIEIQKVYGNIKAEAIKHNLKISHSGEKLMFAMKALGVYIPQMGTIGVSNKLGEVDFKSTFSHETAHFIDNFIGELNGKRWATDNYESLAGRIAFTFRNSMNKNKSDQSDYINATKECFARAMQQYFGMKTEGEDAVTRNVDNKISPEGIEIWKHPNFVNKITFKSEIEPLIEQFLKENLDVFETTVDIDGTNDLAPITEEELDTVDGIKKGLEFYDYYDHIKQRVVSFDDERVFTVPVTLPTLEEDTYRLKRIFKIADFKKILSRQDEFEKEINSEIENRNEVDLKKETETKEDEDFKNAVKSFVKGDLEVGKAIKSLDQVHMINKKLDTLKNHIEKYASQITNPKEVTVRDIDGKPHFSSNGNSFKPLVNRSGEKYFKYLLSLKEPKTTIEDIVASDDLGLLDDEKPEEKIFSGKMENGQPFLFFVSKEPENGYKSGNAKELYNEKGFWIDSQLGFNNLITGYFKDFDTMLKNTNPKYHSQLGVKPKPEEPEESIQDLIDGLQILVEVSEGEEKQELEDTIEGLKLLL